MRAFARGAVASAAGEARRSGRRCMGGVQQMRHLGHPSSSRTMVVRAGSARRATELLAAAASGDDRCASCGRLLSWCGCVPAAWEEADVGGVWKGRLVSLRTQSAKRVAAVLDRRDPIGWSSSKKGWVIDFTRQQATKFPNDVILVKVGDFYEAHGLSAVMLIEHGNLNPMGDWTARAGAPLQNIQKLLDDLVRAGLSVVVCEERDQGIGKRKERYMSERIHANSPQYMHNLIGRESDGTVPVDALPYVGVSRDAAGALRASDSTPGPPPAVDGRLSDRVNCCL